MTSLRPRLLTVCWVKNRTTHPIVSSGPASRSVACRSMTSAAGQKVLNTRTQKDVGESYMSYLDTASFSPRNKTLLFLHGNPTSAYIWRNVIPHVQSLARCVAPDLIGQGRAGKEPRNQYRFHDHYKYLNEFIDKMDFPGKINLVVHDWGSGLGLHWAERNRNRVESITFMEGFVAPIPNWNTWPESKREALKTIRSSSGERMILNDDTILESLLPRSRSMTPDETEEYGQPFKEAGESRRPILTWGREIPIRGDGPQDIIEIVDAYNKWLAGSFDLPKLYIDASPGFYSPWMQTAVSNWPNLLQVQVSGEHVNSSKIYLALLRFTVTCLVDLVGLISCFEFLSWFPIVLVLSNNVFLKKK